MPALPVVKGQADVGHESRGDGVKAKRYGALMYYVMGRRDTGLMQMERVSAGKHGVHSAWELSLTPGRGLVEPRLGEVWGWLAPQGSGTIGSQDGSPS